MMTNNTAPRFDILAPKIMPKEILDEDIEFRDWRLLTPTARGELLAKVEPHSA